MSIVHVASPHGERHTMAQPARGGALRGGRAHHPAEASWCGWIAVMASRLVETFCADRAAQGRLRPIERLPEQQYAAYFAQLLRHVAPSNESPGGPPQEARMLAGRQLALRRLRLELSSAQVAEQTGIDPTTLLLLEAGLAGLTMASKESLMRLAEVPAGGEPTATTGVAVIAVALGGAAAEAPDIVAQVVDDLGSIISQAGAGGAPGAEAPSTAEMREGATDRALVEPARRTVALNWLYSQREDVESARPAERASARQQRCGPTDGPVAALPSLKKRIVRG